MKISLIIPNYNGESFIRETIINCLVGMPDTSVIIVDDCSTDKSIDVIRSISDENVHLISKSENSGFASAINVGLKYCLENKSEVALVANSDIELTKPKCSQIVKVLDIFSTHEVAVLGFLEAGNNEFKENESISGFLFALRLSVIKTVGYFDETFYMYGEEQDYFRRLLKNNFKIIQTGISVKHKTEMSGSSSDKNSWLAIRNSIYLESKNGNIFLVIKKIITLFLIINRLYRAFTIDVSLTRIRRLGFVKGNRYLFEAIIWNIKMRRFNGKS